MFRLRHTVPRAETAPRDLAAPGHQAVPRAGKHSRFTSLFEAFAIRVLQAVTGRLERDHLWASVVPFEMVVVDPAMVAALPSCFGRRAGGVCGPF